MAKAQVIDKIYNFLCNTDKIVNVEVGGAGSGKSYTTAQFLLFEKLYKEKNKRILVARKTLPALRITAYQLILDLLDQYQLPYYINRSEMVISVGSNKVLFKSLDDKEKIKSFEANYVWVEEATEINHQEYMQLKLRLRRQSDTQNQMYLTCNPIDEFHWINMELIKKQKDIGLQYTNYLDNPFLTQEYINELKGLKDEDEQYYQIYTLGQWGVRKNIIYTNWDLVDELPGGGEMIYGLDFGYNDPSALVGIKIKDQEVHIKELLYERKLTNSDLIERLKEIIQDRRICMYADSGEPARIAEISESGFNVFAADKDVETGIDYCKRQKIHITKDSVDLIKEINGYKYKEDRNGRVLDKPVKFSDHLMDAMRYAIYTHYKSRGVKLERPYEDIRDGFWV